MDGSLWREKTSSSVISSLPLWIIEYAWTNRMMEVLQGTVFVIDVSVVSSVSADFSLKHPPYGWCTLQVCNRTFHCNILFIILHCHCLLLKPESDVVVQSSWQMICSFSSIQFLSCVKVLGPPPWLEGDRSSITLMDPCSIRVTAAESWMIVKARDIKHFEQVMEFLDVIHTILPQIVTSIKHMKIMFGLKTLVNVVQWHYGLFRVHFSRVWSII